MPDVETVTTEEETTGTPADAADAFVDAMVKKYGGEDQAEIDEGDDEAPAAGAKAGKTDSTMKDDVKDDVKGSDTADDEHADADTSTDDPDGGAAESTDDSASDDEDENSADDADSDSDDTDGEPTAGGEKGEAKGEEKGEDAASETGADGEDVAAILAKAGADTKLADVPDKYRPLVERKLRSIDAAFTRVQQERTAFRKERAALVAEERFRDENAALYFAEQIVKKPELMAAVNVELDKLELETDAGKPERAKTFEVEVEAKRKAAAAATEKEYAEAVERKRQASERGLAVHELAKRLSEKADVPFRVVEKAILLRLTEKVAAKQTVDVTDAEVVAIVTEEAREHKRATRATERRTSQDAVKARTDSRRNASPAVRTPGSATSPRPAPSKKVVVDQSNEDDRIAAMMRTARRVMPGVR